MYMEEYYQLSDWAKIIQKDCIATSSISIKSSSGEIILSSQLHIYQLIGKYSFIHIPRGPICSESVSDKSIQKYIQKLSRLANRHNAIFTLIEPSIMPIEILNLLQTYTKSSTLERLPHQTQILDLSNSEKTLLAQMNSKMRYNINLAKRKGVKIIQVTSQDDSFETYFDAFYQLIQDTRTRNNFAIHTRDHYRHIFSTSVPTLQVSLALAIYQETVLAANILLDTPTQRIYLHGASSNSHRNLMAPPLLQWESIIEAKHLGKSFYDFWGISTTKTSWSGITRFKKQFGGESITYPESRMVIHKPFIFSLYKLFRRIRHKSI